MLVALAIRLAVAELLMDAMLEMIVPSLGPGSVATSTVTRPPARGARVPRFQRTTPLLTSAPPLLAETKLVPGGRMSSMTRLEAAPLPWLK